MKRRSLLAVAATAGLAGCTAPSNTGRPEPDSNTDRKNAFDDYEWRHRISGRYLNVSNGTLYGIKIGPEDEEDDQFTGETGSGNLFSLDLQNGNLRWTQGFSGALQNIVVRDAIYYETVNDAYNSWVSAIEFDGTRRWKGSEGHDTLGGRLERVTENAIYVSDESLKAIDPNTGDLLWEFAGIRPIHFGTVAGTTAETASVYGVVDSDIAALDVDEGKVQWRYEPDDDYTSFDISDGVVYAANNEAVAAIADGEERWRVKLSPSSSSLRIHGVASGLVLVKDDSYLYAVAVADGQKQWEREMTRHRRSGNHLYEGDLRVYDNRIYSGKRGEQEISVFQLGDGTDLWSTDIGSEVESWEVVSKEQFGSEGSVFVQTNRELQSVNLDGDITRTWTPRENPSQNEQIYDFAVNENVIVSTYSGTYALES